MTEESATALCERVTDDMASVLDGSASAQLLAHVAECDDCRDARHDAERAELLMSQAGSDFSLPAGLKERLAVSPPVAEAAHDTAPAPTPTTAPAPALVTAPPPAPPPEAAPVTATSAPSDADSNVAPSASPAPLPSLATGAEPRRSSVAVRLAPARRFALPALAVAAALALFLGSSGESGTSDDDPQLVGPPWRGKVAKVLTRNGKLEICAPSGSSCRTAQTGDEVPAGSQLRTDGATLAELAFTDGSTLSLDRETTLRLSANGRGGHLSKGGLVSDVAHHPESGVRFEFKSGHLDVLGTKFSLRTDDDSVAVHVARGQVRLADGAGRTALVLAGEEGRVYPGSPPVTSAGAGLGEALGWSEAVQPVEEQSEPEPRPRALGELKAKKPGASDELSGAVRLDSHAVRVKIAGSVARTEVEEVFTNQTDDVLEGIFRFPLPPDAKIERLALEVDGRLEEGAFVDRERAAAIWRGAIVQAAPQLRQQIKDEIVWVAGPWRDPALLEWQRGGRFELRIYPIPKRGSRRVVLAYSQLVKQAAGVRHYSYPLGFDPSGNSTALDFSLDVQVRGQDPSFRVRTPGWDMSRAQEGGAERLRYEAKSFTPTGDFSLDYALEDRASEVSAWAYRDVSANGTGADSGEPYVALALRPKLPHRAERGAGRAVALVVDASRSVFGENYRRASALAIRMARDLDSFDRVTVLACDSTCRQLPGELRVPGTRTALEVRRFLEHETPAGASDITLAVGRGFAAVRDSGRAPHVLYIGDGTATAGPIRPGTIERAVKATLPRGGRVTTLGIGPESDVESLLALARGGSGSALPYVPGQPLADAALAALSALYGAALSDVQLQLPEGISQVSPARFDPIVAGSELLVVGRMSNLELRGDVVLKGNLHGQPFEQRYPLRLSASDSSGNAFVPRLFAAGRIADLERDGSDTAKRDAIALSTRHSVASRYTSLLVLESEAMYKAFGLDNARKTPEYTADLEADGSSANGELALSEEETKNESSAERLSRADSSSGAAAGPRFAAKPSAGLSGLGSRGHASNPYEPGSPAFAPAPAPAASPSQAEARGPLEDARSEPKKKAAAPIDMGFDDGAVLAPRARRPNLVPMRRIWERKGEVLTDRFVPKLASDNALSEAERELAQNESRRASLKKVFALRSAAGDVPGAARLAERWLQKEPLDPEALTALADVEARRGHRDAAIRMLGSVLDVRPGDTAAHKRLARLERWAGRADLACRHNVAMAETRSKDLALMAEAVVCARATGMPEVAEALLGSAAEAGRRSIERLAEQPASDNSALSGDLRLEATWSGSADLDLSLIDTEGHRVSWLGAGTRSVISARDSTSTSREGLALRGAAPGEYVLELTRASGSSSARGDVLVTIAGTTRRIPFSMDGDRQAVALVRITTQSRLVPL